MSEKQRRTLCCNAPVLIDNLADDKADAPNPKCCPEINSGEHYFRCSKCGMGACAVVVEIKDEKKK